MPSLRTIYSDIMQGNCDNNIKFRELQRLLDAVKFKKRIKGDHFIYSLPRARSHINIQPDGSFVKPYQVKQVRKYFNEYNITLEEE